MTRKEIEKFSGVEPNCFETDREEDWYKIGCIDGLEAADAEPDTTKLWYEVDDEPLKGRSIIILDTKGNVDIISYLKFRSICKLIDTWGVTIKRFKIKKWAYIKDLLPKTK